MYKLVKNMFTEEVCAINKSGDGFILSIPVNPDNTDYQAYLKFLEDGGTPLPAENT